MCTYCMHKGSWHIASNWNPSVVPNSSGASVTINSNAEITIESPITIGSLSLGATLSPTLIVKGKQKKKTR